MTPSEAAKEARSGKDMGAPGPGFANIVSKTKGKYGEAAAEKIAGAVMQKKRKKGTL
jgi:hypothetical protein